MKKLIFLILLFWTNLSSFAAPSKLNLPTNSGDFITAKINNKAITNSELIDRYRYVVTSSKISIQSIDDQKLLLNQILDKMVDEELIRQEAAALKIEATPEEVGDAVEMVALQQKKNPTQFKVFFINNGFSFDHYLKQVEAEILWSKIISETLRSKVKVTEVEVKEFFEQHKFNTDVKKFHVAEILISPTGKSAQTAEQFATKLAIELRQGADFRNLVKQFSNGITAENNGEIGWVSQSDIDPKIYNAISKLTKGGYSDPVSLSDGFHIFKLLETKTETKIADQDLNAARNAIFSRKLQTLAKGYLMDIRKKAFVEIK
ncbi:MAG: peptidylprolyl isomerase [Pseudomonadota bacterium]